MLDENINSELVHLSVCFRANKLFLNIDKTIFLFRNNRESFQRNPLATVIDGINISQSFN